MRRPSEADPNQNLRAIPEYLILEHGVFDLDDMIVKNVIFRDSHIIYRGRQISMEASYFVRCSFDVPFTQEGDHFLSALLVSVPASFKSSSN